MIKKNLSKTVQNKRFTEPYTPDTDLIIHHNISISRKPFLLEKDHYQMLTKNSPYFIVEIANGIGTSGILNLLFFVARYYSKGSSDIQNWEKYGTFSAILFWIIVLLCQRFVPTKKKLLMKKIQHHFDTDIGTVSSTKAK